MAFLLSLDAIYLCCSCMAVLHGSAAWERVSSSLWVSLEILSPPEYQSLMQNKESALNPTCLDGHESWGLVHWAINSAYGWCSWLTLCILTSGTIGTEKENSDLPFRPVLSSSCTLGKKQRCSWPVKLLFCPSDFSVLYPFPLALPDCPNKEHLL